MGDGKARESVLMLKPIANTTAPVPAVLQKTGALELARHGKAWQSSDYGAGMNAQKAIRGSRMSARGFGGCGDYSHTRAGDSNPRWRVSLASVSAIECVEVYARPGFSRRLRNLRLSFIDGEGREISGIDKKGVETEAFAVQIDPPLKGVKTIELRKLPPLQGGDDRTFNLNAVLVYGVEKGQARGEKVTKRCKSGMVKGDLDYGVPSSAVPLIGDMRSLRASCHPNNPNLSGWGKAATELSYCIDEGPVFTGGLVGCCFRVLDVQTDYGEEVQITGVKSDTPNPFKILVSNNAREWKVLAEDMLETVSWPSRPVSARYSRLVWDNTRGSNGFHCQLYGVDTKNQQKRRSPADFKQTSDELKRIVMSRAKQGSLATASDSPELPTLVRQKSEQKRSEWVSPDRQIPSSYRKAHEMICLKPEWICHTKTGATLKALQVDFQDHSKALQSRGFFNKVAIQLIMKGYNLQNEGKASRQQCLFTGRNVLSTLSDTFNWLAWRKPYFTMALLYFRYLGTPDMIVAKLGEFCDRAVRCASAKRLAFDLMVKQVHKLITGRNERVGGDDAKEMSLGACIEKCRNIFEEYIDLHKDMAYKSAFEEPCRCYFNAHHNAVQRDHFEVHGFNWYLAGTMAAIGMQLPLIPYMRDSCCMGFAAHWDCAGGETMWTHFKQINNFGKRFEAIPELKRMRDKKWAVHKRTGLKVGVVPPLSFGQSLTGKENTRTRKWSRYVERLCHFFTMDFFCEKAVSVLMQENTDNPGLLGFVKVLDALFLHYKAKKAQEGVKIKEEDATEFIYDDVACMYDIPRINNLLHLAGITRSEVPLKPREIKLETTPKQDSCQAEIFSGSRALYDRVKQLLAEGKAQHVIFAVCTEESMGSNAEIFKALRAVRRNEVSY
eukprot:CAMPEP_0114496562 /NCGR_PEP_ID=MMETSP0109-20121206/5838_1 /TAXON_ID=29199 /ORGANISM="Chlorarachnion reptans, Strain CCCM449" /LENGTH=891 /DNA_ID=CAMNT_0001673847 /DNA_START=134 /DNA_END=2808 /DNA_ORIENTATION=+